MRAAVTRWLRTPRRKIFEPAGLWRAVFLAILFGWIGVGYGIDRSTSGTVEDIVIGAISVAGGLLLLALAVMYLLRPSTIPPDPGLTDDLRRLFRRNTGDRRE